MSEIKIRRRMRDVAVTLHSTTTLATTLNLSDMAGGVVSLGTFSTNAATLHMFGATAEAGPYRRLFGSDGSAADITLSATTGTPSSSEGRMYSLPDAVFAVPYLKIVSATTNSTGTSGVVVFKS
jgi:hypothetical protein